jgi:hypothetical protein
MLAIKESWSGKHDQYVLPVEFLSSPTEENVTQNNYKQGETKQTNNRFLCVECGPQPDIVPQTERLTRGEDSDR